MPIVSSTCSRRGALLQRGLGVEGDAGVAAGGDRNGQRDQLLGAGIQRVRLQRRLGEGGEALHHLRRAGAQLAQIGRHLGGQGGPVLQHDELRLLQVTSKVSQASAVSSVAFSSITAGPTRDNAALPAPSRRLAGNADGDQRRGGAQAEGQHAQGAEQRAEGGAGGGQRGIEKAAGQQAQRQAQRVAAPGAVAVDAGGDARDRAAPAGRRPLQHRRSPAANRGASRRSPCSRNIAAASSSSAADEPAEPRQPGQRAAARAWQSRRARRRWSAGRGGRAAALPHRSGAIRKAARPAGGRRGPPPGPARSRRTSARNASRCRPPRQAAGRARSRHPDRRRSRRRTQRRQHVEPRAHACFMPESAGESIDLGQCCCAA